MTHFRYVRVSDGLLPRATSVRTLMSRVMPARILTTGALLIWSSLALSQQFLVGGCDSACLPAFNPAPSDLSIDCTSEFPAFDLPAATGCDDAPIENTPHVELDEQVVVSYSLGTAYGPGDDWALWLGNFEAMGLGASDHFIPGADGVEFNLYANGTGRITGRVVNDTDPDQQFDVDLFLQYGQDYDSWSGQGRFPKDDLGLMAYADWTFFEVVDTLSHLKGAGAFEGDVLYLDHMPVSRLFGFQLGADGANNRNTNFGISGWFWYRGVMGGNPVTGTGDVNADLTDETTLALACPVVASVERHALAWSSCGHHLVSYTIERLDAEPPVFVELPPLTASDCTSLPDTADLTEFVVNDACGSDVTLEVLSDVVEGEPCNQVLTRTWRLTDACGNIADTFQVVTLVDTTGPSFLLTDIDLTCEEWDDFIPETPSFEDNCTPAESISWTVEEGTPSGNFPSDFTLPLIYTATDLCGNSTVQIALVTVTDSVAPEFSGTPEDVTLSCDAWEGYTIIIPDATDNCDVNLAPAVVDTTMEEGACPGSFTAVLTFTVTDAAGNATSTSQTILVEDNLAPQFTEIPGNVSIECGSPLPQDLPLAEDNCSDPVLVTLVAVDSLPGECPQDWTVIRTFAASDACGNEATAQQTVIISDTQAPAMDNLPADIVLACGEDLPDHAITAFDACGEVTLTEAVDTLLIDCPGSFTLIRTFTATDDCGNATQAQQSIQVIDTTPPVVDVLPEATILCDEDLPTNLPPAEDACSNPVMVELFSVDSIQGDCPQAWEVTLTFLATDACGNTAQSSQLVHVVDTLAPVLVLGLDSVVLECGSPLPVNLPAYADACDPMVNVLELMPDSMPGACPGEYTVTRHFEATDACGNASMTSQTVTFIDTGAPEFDFVPGPVTIQCDESLPTDLPTALDDCSGPVSIVLLSVDSVQGACPQAWEVTRTFLATDACGNEQQATQMVTIEDTTAPEIDASTVPEDAFFSCSVEHPTCADFDVLAFDNCGETAVDCAVDTIPTACPATFTLAMTFTATDECANDTLMTVYFDVADTTAPVLDLDLVPANDTIQCGMDPDLLESTDFSVEDDCSEWTFSATRETTGEDENPCNYFHTDTYTFTDCDGNETVFVHILTVIDTEGPSMSTAFDSQGPYFCAFEVPEYEMPITASMVTDEFPFDQVDDNCAADDEIIITYSDSILAQNGENNYTVQRTWSLTDHCDNKTEVVQVIIVEEPELILPNAFSPGTNGYNDVFVIENVSVVDEGDTTYPPCDWGPADQQHFMVFNRWGNEVYSLPAGEPYRNDWDGRSNSGETLVDGTYFVLLRLGDRKLGSYVDLRNDK
jgi:hypothetical protein